MDYGRTVEVRAEFDDAVPMVKRLRGAGVRHAQGGRPPGDAPRPIGAVIEPYVILGTCNPRLSHHAVQAEPRIGLLLPCNVVVRRVGSRTMVHALEPGVMVDVPGNPDLRPVADEASRLIDAALRSLTTVAADA